MLISKKDSASWCTWIFASLLLIILTSGLRLLTSKTEFPGKPVTPGIVIRPGAADVGTAREPTVPVTAGTARPAKVLIAMLETF